MNVTVQQVRTAFQALLVAKSTITADVAEYQYQGQAYGYPCVRYGLDCEPNECGGYDVNFTVYCFSEGVSSLQAEQIGDQLSEALDGARVSSPIKLQNTMVTQVRRPQRDDRLWRVEVYGQCVANS